MVLLYDSKQALAMRMFGRIKEHNMCKQQSQTTIPCGENMERIAPKKEITAQALAACTQPAWEADIDPDHPDGDLFRRTSVLS